MTEKEIQLLGFEKHNGNDYPEFYYYYYKVSDGMGLISCADTDVKDNEWYVEIFNTEPSIRFYLFGEVQSLLNLLEKRKL